MTTRPTAYFDRNWMFQLVAKLWSVEEEAIGMGLGRSMGDVPKLEGFRKINSE